VKVLNGGALVELFASLRGKGGKSSLLLGRRQNALKKDYEGKAGGGGGVRRWRPSLRGGRGGGAKTLCLLGSEGRQGSGGRTPCERRGPAGGGGKDRPESFTFLARRIAGFSGC